MRLALDTCGSFPGMRSSETGHERLRGSSLLLVPAAAFAVHQLRYWLTYGSHANAELTAQGHSYLTSLVPWTVLALGIGATLFLRRTARALATGTTTRPTRLSLSALWAITTVGLVAIYAVQETLESFLSYGHPGGVAGVFGHGGLWSVPAAALIAVAVVAVLRAGRAVLAAASRFRPRVARLRLIPTVVPAGALPVVARPLARAAAGRAPPRALRCP